MKQICSFFTIIAMCATPLAHAEDAPSSAQTTIIDGTTAPEPTPTPAPETPTTPPTITPTTTDTIPPEAPLGDTPELAPDADTMDEGTPVGPVSSTKSKKERNRTWQNIGLAVAAVAVAIVALVLVSSNSGHHKK